MKGRERMKEGESGEGGRKGGRKNLGLLSVKLSLVVYAKESLPLAHT